MLTASNKDQASSANKAPMRHRIMAVEYDARVNTLNVVIQDDWQELDKQLWANNQRLVKEQLLNDFGVSNGDQKLADFIALGIMPFSVIVSHNSILHQVRDAFTAGTYYPALVSAVSLGERILNQILLGLRDDFKDNDKTKLIRGKNTTDNWPRAIEIIKAWGVFDDDLAKDYLALYKLRVAAVHYLNPGLDNDSREEALDAIILLQKIVERRFSAISQKDLT